MDARKYLRGREISEILFAHVILNRLQKKGDD